MATHNRIYQSALGAVATIALAMPGFAQYQPQPIAPQAPQSQAPQSAPAPALPQALTLPAGAVITVRVAQPLSSDRDQPGDVFDAVLDQPVVANGWVVARRGQTVMGRVVVAQKADHSNKETSELGVELTGLTLVDGQQVPLHTQLLQSSGGGIPGGQEVATVAAPTGIGAIIGGAAAGGAGAGIGAVAGATAGVIGVALTHGRPTIIPAEAELAFQQIDPVTVSTTQSAQAFQPVTQQDYAYAGAMQYGPGAAPAGAPLPGYAPAAPYPAYYGYGYPYPYPYGWGYPYWGWGYPYFGVGIGFGWGPGYFGRFGYGGFGRAGFRR